MFLYVLFTFHLLDYIFNNYSGKAEINNGLNNLNFSKDIFIYILHQLEIKMQIRPIVLYI